MCTCVSIDIFIYTYIRIHTSQYLKKMNPRSQTNNMLVRPSTLSYFLSHFLPQEFNTQIQKHAVPSLNDLEINKSVTKQ